jgi:hypothetical protein
MKYQEALIAWTPKSDQIRVGPLLGEYDPDWTARPIRYRLTGGAAYTGLCKCEDKTLRDMMLFIEFHTIVVRDEVPVEAVHKAFLAIDEYRERISPDISGAAHDGDVLGGW